ncbi:MAG: hypothetical protein WCV90_06855 [Candidatus Woesearchaeota archaeon]|jgi:hypothetical protein
MLLYFLFKEVMGSHAITTKTILQWKSKVQYKKGTPYIALIRHLSQQHAMAMGNELSCKLIVEEDKLKVVIDLE